MDFFSSILRQELPLFNLDKESNTSPCCVVCSAKEEEKPASSCGELYVEDGCVEEVFQLYASTAFKPECSHHVALQPMTSLKIWKRECCTILDTGAEASLISTAVLDENDWSPQIGPHPTMVLMGITGKDLISSFAFLQLNFSESSQSKPYKFAVVDELFILCCALLGLDFLAANGIVLDLHHGYSQFLATEWRQ